MAAESKADKEGLSTADAADGDEAFMIRGTVFESLAGAPSPAPAMLQLLQGKLVTQEELERQLVSPEQVVVALVNQLAAVPSLAKYASDLLRSLETPEALAAVTRWQDIMAHWKHRKAPSAWQPYTLGCVDMDGRTALEAALAKGDTERAMAYLNSGFGRGGCGRIGSGGSTALMVGISHGRKAVCVKMLQLFGARGCRAAHVDEQLFTALTNACLSRMRDVAVLLIEAGADECNAGHVDDDGNTALSLACIKGLGPVADKLLDLGPLVCHAGLVNSSGWTPLMQACKWPLPSVALRLVEMGADVCSAAQVEEDYGDTALLKACDNGLEEVALALLALGTAACNADHVGSYGMTALQVACANGLTAVAMKLLDLSAGRAAHVNEYGKTALILACQHRLPGVALRLLALGRDACNLHHANNNGDSARDIAARWNEDMQPVVQAIDTMPPE